MGLGRRKQLCGLLKKQCQPDKEEWTTFTAISSNLFILQLRKLWAKQSNLLVSEPTFNKWRDWTKII